MALLWWNKDVCMNFQQAFSNSSEKQEGMFVRAKDWIEEKKLPSKIVNIVFLIWIGIQIHTDLISWI